MNYKKTSVQITMLQLLMIDIIKKQLDSTKKITITFNYETNN